MEKGELVPDNLIIQMVKDRLHEKECRKGFILDGFPRTVIQAEKLNELLYDMGLTLDGVVSIDVAKDEIIHRLSQRMVCETCGELVSRKQKEEKCPVCGGTLVRRKDDEPETIERRLDVYEAQTRSLVRYYEGRKLLRAVDGSGSVEEIYRIILSVLKVAHVKK
jgi:adenylate kinase